MISAVRDYLAHCAAVGCSHSTLRNYHQKLGIFRRFARREKVRHPRNVSAALLRDYHHSLIDRGLQRESLRSYLLALHGFLGWLFAAGRILSDVASRMEIPRRARALPERPLGVEEVGRLIESVSPVSLASMRDRAVLEVLYACGLRRSELLGLNVADVAFADRTLFVRGKGGKDRVLPIHASALAALAAYLKARGAAVRGSDPLFATHPLGVPSRGRFTGGALDALFRKLTRGSARHLHPHLLRHTFAVHLLQNGADVRHVQELLGHGSPETTSGYLGLTKDALKAAYDAAVEAAMGA